MYPVRQAGELVSPPLGLVLAGICFFSKASWFAHQRIASQPGAVGARNVKTTRYASAGQVHFTYECPSSGQNCWFDFAECWL